MNYIREINGFYKEQETNPLSSSGATLWHALMHVNNGAGWRKEFTVAVSVLCCKAALTESTFKRARLELQAKGYIRYESRGGNRAAMYEIISLASTMDRNQNGKSEKSQEETQIVDDKLACSMDESFVLQSKKIEALDDNTVPLLKQKETKEKISTAAADVIAFYKINVGKVRPYITEEIVRWVNDVGADLVLAAMKRALERHKESWGYVKAILEDWLKKGFVDIKDTEKEVVMYQNQSKGYSKEVIPDWFETRNSTSREELSIDDELESAELNILLAGFS